MKTFEKFSLSYQLLQPWQFVRCLTRISGIITWSLRTIGVGIISFCQDGDNPLAVTVAVEYYFNWIDSVVFF